MLQPEQIKQMRDQADVLFSAAAVSAAVDKVAAAINATPAIADTHPLLLCVMTGGVVFTGQLMTRLDFPLDFDYLHVTRYGQDLSGGALSWRAAPWKSVKDRTVVVVDDILDEGVTLAVVRERLLQMGATAVFTVVLADKENGKKKPIEADFVALSVPDRFVFGYGMDAHGAWRNLPAIYAMKEL